MKCIGCNVLCIGEEEKICIIEIDSSQFDIFGECSQKVID